MNNNLHEAQAKILKELLFHNGTNFTSLNKTELTSDQFTHHVKQLVKADLIEKQGQLYFLTEKGKIVGGQLDTESLKFEKWGKASVAVTGKKTINGKDYYLVQQRLKEPFYKYWGHLNGKIRFGETAAETAARELKEETGLNGKPKYVATHHLLRGPSENNIILDNYFYIFCFTDADGTLMDTQEGHNQWKTAEEIKTLQTFPGFSDSQEMILKPGQTFLEKFYRVEKI
jgi:8-oxo-dGTP pyrophosphatase MutT (NUDIX family)